VYEEIEVDCTHTLLISSAHSASTRSSQLAVSCTMK